MKTILALALFLAVAAAAQPESYYQNMFTNWMIQNQRSYNHKEFSVRYNVFKKNVDFVEQHNQLGLHKCALNKFADMTVAEFTAKYTGLKHDAGKVNASLVHAETAVNAPASFDWRSKGAVTPIKNQGQCGSCWSFSTTGSTEGCHKLAGHTLVSLSEQNLVDCSDSYGNEGCNGGLMTQAMQYIIANGGIDTEASYPYTAEDGSCSYNAANSGATLSGFTNIAAGDENDLLAKNVIGPVSVAIDASHSSFQFYASGVYNEPACSSTQLDHGVLAIGWGTSGSTPYWLVKNSWGTDWGQAGYIWMSRNANNQCGIATAATIPQCQ